MVAGFYQFYCGRGDVENRLKELHHGLEMDRTSCSQFLANQFRVLLTLAAYVLFQELRRRAAKTTCADAQVTTLRERLIKRSSWRSGCTARRAGLSCTSPQQAHEGIEARCEQVLAAEITDDALLGAAVLPVGLDEADVFVVNASAACGLHRAENHLSPHDRPRVPRSSRNICYSSVTTNSARARTLSRNFTHLLVAPVPNRGNMG